MEIEGIKNFEERMKEIESDEGWESSGDMDIDDFYPDFEEDVNVTIRGLYLGNITIPRKSDGKLLTYAIIRTPQNKNVAVKHFELVKKAVENAVKGDGLRITYLGPEDKKKGEGFYHNFKVEIKKFVEDKQPQTPTLADNDDPEAVSQIEFYEEIIHKNKPGLSGEDLSKEIIKLAEEDEDMDEYAMARLKAQLVVNAQKTQ